MVDIIAPLGKGQRALIVALPRSGKTMLLKDIARSITDNHSEVVLIVLLVDERPEEVMDVQLDEGEDNVLRFRRGLPATRPGRRDGAREGQASGRAQEGRRHPARLHHPPRPRLQRRGAALGQELSGGVDAKALQRPKRFFGAARNVEEGGSLTIMATALIDTGSKMDEVIFEEFKGTGNMEIGLDRQVSEERIYPSIDINKSGTRKEELLVKQGELSKMWVLRPILVRMGTVDAMPVPARQDEGFEDQ